MEKAKFYNQVFTQLETMHVSVPFGLVSYLRIFLKVKRMNLFWLVFIEDVDFDFGNLAHCFIDNIDQVVQMVKDVMC